MAMATVFSGCLYFPGGTDLGQVARETGMRNITTGDGTFENYTAVGYYKGMEFGISAGIPGLFKIELFPIQSNEGLLKQIAREAKNDGADAMINVKPHKEVFTGLPFTVIGLHIDWAKGTGIKLATPAPAAPTIPLRRY
jgi:hypothetical protein